MWVYTGADKSLARPGRKQATATKLGIYSIYSPRSSIHFLDRCSNFCKPLKKNSEVCPSNKVSAAVMTASDEKWRHFNGFLVQGTGGSPTGPDPENRVRDQDIGSLGRPVFSGLHVPGEPGALSCKNKTTLVTCPRRFYFKMSFNYTSRDE